MKQGYAIFKLFSFLLILGIGREGSAAITVDSVVTVPSRCANDGTITVYAHNGTSLLYAIDSGSDIRPAQSGHQFGGLASGTYQILVTDFSNDTAFISATVGGTYTFPDFTPTYVNPACRHTATGTIVGNANTGLGKPPYSWILTNLGTNATVIQVSDSFFDLPEGDYNLRQYDSCQSFATRYMSLTTMYDSFFISNTAVISYKCDSAVISLQLYQPLGTGALIWPPYGLPYTIDITTPDTAYSFVNPLAFGGGQSGPYSEVDYHLALPRLKYGDSVYITVTDGCGLWQSVANILTPFNPVGVTSNIEYDTCHPTVASYFYLQTYYWQSSSFFTYMSAPVTVSIYDYASHVFIDSTVTDDSTVFSLHSVNVAYAPPMVPGQTYMVDITDRCGNASIFNYTAPALPASFHSVNVNNFSCLDSSAGLDIYESNYFYTLPTFELLSGPSFIQSTKPHYAYRDTIIYPQSFSGTQIFLYGLGIGTYHYRMYDSCGNSVTDTFVVRPQDVSDNHYSISYTKGCPGQNKIDLAFSGPATTSFFGGVGEGYFSIIDPATNAINGPLFMPYYSYLTDSVGTDWDTLYNYNASKYVLKIDYSTAGTAINHYLNCISIYDTIIIPPYQQPEISYATQIKCNGTVNVGLLPDSSKGVAPYQYEILSGPQTTAAQVLNFFTLTQPGTYVARISDTCGYARTYTFSVDTLSFAQIVKVGSSCIGNDVTLVSQHSPYATYIWHRPDGSHYTGDSLHISPVLPANYGIYYIEKIVSVNGCKDTFYTSYTLASNNISYLYDTICAGQSATFVGRNYTVSGVYYDTIPTAACDSIVQFNLFVRHAYDSVRQTICFGQTFQSNGHIYSAAGIYRDTFTTSPCDSIRILDLLVLPAIYNSGAVAICGGSVHIGAHYYSATGVYTDTMASVSGCDSIYTLHLTVNPTHNGIYNFSVCSGDSVRFGNTYYSTGVYIDSTLFAGSACDSFTVILVNPGSYRYATVEKDFCPGQALIYHGFNYPSTGTYFLDTVATVGCDSITMLYIHLGTTKYDSLSQNICAGQSVTVGVHTYSAAGIYRDTFPSISCDSIHILNLHVGHLTIDSVSQHICTAQSVTVGTHIYTVTGIYRDTFSTISCDSIHVLNLQVAMGKTDSISQAICDGQSISVGSHVYMATGTYRDTFSTSGCDSIHILKLLVTKEKDDSVSLSICTGGSISVGVHIYTTSGIYRDTFATTGCDSVHILNLVVGSQKRDTIIVNICEGTSITIEGQTYTEAGSRTDTFSSALCDSMHTILINTFPLPVISISASDTNVAIGDTVQLYLNSNQQISYDWTSSASISNVHIAGPKATLSQSAWIIATATDFIHCMASDSIYINVKDCESAIYVPNAFTPNGDDINDRYQVFERCAKLIRMCIFNRWGEKVWDANSAAQTWDGTYRGTAQPAGVYVYWLEYINNRSGEYLGKELKGSITLIR